MAQWQSPAAGKRTDPLAAQLQSENRQLRRELDQLLQRLRHLSTDKVSGDHLLQVCV